jgi:hypothetical protein
MLRDIDVEWCDELDNCTSRCMGFIDDTPIHEGDDTWLCCLLEDKQEIDNSLDIPF